ncbi:MAG: sel1 repeat family protein [Chromatiales bacterium]|nr:sel1 repeat family protein [Chromatiales bacterium]
MIPPADWILASWASYAACGWRCRRPWIKVPCRFPLPCRRGDCMSSRPSCFLLLLSCLAVLSGCAGGEHGPEDYAAVEAARGAGDYALALRLVRTLAEAGNATAQASLARRYREGEGVPQDYGLALRWYRLAAEQGLALAQVNLGVMYAAGEGVPSDYAEARRWYLLAAEQGNSKAQNNLGIMYQQGLGLLPEPAEAVAWYRRAARQGHPAGQTNLGFMYQSGLGVQRDATEAVRWYRRAAEQGYTLGQFNLAVSYRDGNGVPQDFVAAHKWFNLAGVAGSSTARNERDRLAVAMTTAQVAEAQRRAREFAAAMQAPGDEPDDSLAAGAGQDLVVDTGA